MRASLVSTLSVFIWLAAGLPGTAQERAALENPAVRVAPLNTASTAQPMGSPVLGFVESASNTVSRGRRSPAEGLSTTAAQVRAILGVPGAAIVSSPLALPRGIQNVYFAPGENYALAEQLEGTLALISFTGTQAGPLQAIPGTLSRPDIVSFSPSGSAAAVFSIEEGHLAIITGLPNSPQLAHDLSAADLPAGIQMLALADDGATLLAGASDGRVLMLRPGSAPAPVYSAGQLGGIVFAPASSDALVFDGAGAKVVLLQNVATAPATRMLAEGLTGFSGAALLQVDSGAAVVGAMNGKQISRIDLQTLHVDNLTLPAPLTMLQPLRASHRFLLSALQGQPAWILDMSGEIGAVYFVPRQSVAVMAR